MTKLVLPYPISANDFWRTAYAKNLRRCIVHPTREAQQWKKTAALMAVAAGFREPTSKSVALHITLHHRAIVQSGKNKGHKNGHVFDLDNVLKVSIDGLKGVVYEDDRQVKRIVAEYGEPTESGKLVIDIQEFVPRQAAIFAPDGHSASCSGAGEVVGECPCGYLQREVV